MNSSQKPARSTERDPDALLVRDGGLPYAPSGECDPFEAWAELMEVVEALCPAGRYENRRRMKPRFGCDCHESAA